MCPPHSVAELPWWACGPRDPVRTSSGSVTFPWHSRGGAHNPGDSGGLGDPSRKLRKRRKARGGESAGSAMGSPAPRGVAEGQPETSASALGPWTQHQPAGAGGSSSNSRDHAPLLQEGEQGRHVCPARVAISQRLHACTPIIACSHCSRAHPIIACSHCTRAHPTPASPFSLSTCTPHHSLPVLTARFRSPEQPSGLAGGQWHSLRFRVALALPEDSHQEIPRQHV